MKNVISITILLVFSISFSIAQLPAYVPTDSLVAWFPFNGNAYDYSGNNNHLTNYGASLTNDRFNNYNSAYNVQSYSGLRKTTPISNGVNVTYSFWVYASSSGANIIAETNSPLTSNGLNCLIQNYIPKICTQGVAANVTNATATIGQNTWYFIVLTKQGTQFKLYINGILTSQGSSNMNSFNSSTNFFISAGVSNSGGFSGNIDDVGIWNRALTQTEITTLYNACSDTIIVNQPLNQSIAIGSNARFLVSAPTYTYFQWQTNTNHLGWLNIPSNSYYLGVNNDTLFLNNAQVSNHLQQFRLLATYNNCIDTSNIATLFITDTCIVSFNDTNIISFYDTIMINDTNHIIYNDTSYIVLNDTNHVIINDTNYLVFDTNYVIINDTNFIILNDTNYIVLNDTNFVIINDTNFMVWNDTNHVIINDTNYIILNDTNYVIVNDTNLIIINDTNQIIVYDTNYIYVFDTSYVIINDTSYMIINDTNYIVVNDTSYIILTDTNYVIINDTNHIVIYDTNHIIVNDTNYVSVTDTLIIDVNLHIESNNIVNTIKIFPNPAKDYLIIDFGDFESMSAYLLKITNLTGQIIYFTPIYKQTTQLDLSTWLGEGIYFVQILDTKNNVIVTKKIVLK